MSESKSKTAKRNIRILKDLESMTQKEVAEKYKLSTASIKAIKAKANAAAGDGLGDVVEKITKATGIKKVVELFNSATGQDCNCDKRKEKMNIAFPTRRTIECMTEEMYDTFGKIKDLKNLGSSERAEVARIHAHVFKHKVVVPCTCTPKRWMQFMSELTKVYDSY